MGGQGGHRTAVQSADGIIRVRDGKIPAQQPQGEGNAVPADIGQPVQNRFRVQRTELLLIIGKGNLFFAVFYLHVFCSLIV